MTTETAVRMPRINEPAPEFHAKSTHGMIRLSDYLSKGKWVMLFSHPADFTPVCTTEFVEFARNQQRFGDLNVQPIGVSIDSVFSHIAWVRNIEQHFGVKVDFPVIADLDQKVAQSYGMVHEAASETATVRAVFLIDPKGIVRAILYYPMTLGRNVDEIFRMLEGLQTADKNACAIPANWRPGQPVVVPPPQTQADAAARVKESSYEVTDWYLSRRPLAEAAKK